MTGDRFFGLVMILVALAYVASAFQIQSGFLSDPVGSKTFPLVIAGVAILCSLIIVLRPDPVDDWPRMQTWVALGIAVIVLVAYAYILKPLGFLIPTALAAGILSYQIAGRPVFAALAGLGLSLGLFALFRYALGLGLQPLPHGFGG